MPSSATQLGKYAKAKYEKYRFGHRQGFRSGGSSRVQTIQPLKTSADCLAGIHQVLLQPPKPTSPPPPGRPHRKPFATRKLTFCGNHMFTHERAFLFKGDFVECHIVQN